MVQGKHILFAKNITKLREVAINDIRQYTVDQVFDKFIFFAPINGWDRMGA
jgi:hypothetical protein